jgi:cobalt-zinc-cadmium efflux system protein
VLLEATPAGLDLAKLEQAIRGVAGVLDTHDIHVWTVSSGLIADSCHIVVADQSVTNSQKIQQNVAHMLEHDFKISHSTIQVEAEDCGGHEHKAHSEHQHHHEHAH